MLAHRIRLEPGDEAEHFSWRRETTLALRPPGPRSTKRTTPQDELVTDCPSEGRKQNDMWLHTRQGPHHLRVSSIMMLCSRNCRPYARAIKHDHSSSTLICSQARHGKSSGWARARALSFQALREGKNYFLQIMGELEQLRYENEGVAWILNQLN